MILHGTFYTDFTMDLQQLADMGDQLANPSTSQEGMPLSAEEYASLYHSCYEKDELPCEQGK